MCIAFAKKHGNALFVRDISTLKSNGGILSTLVFLYVVSVILNEAVLTISLFHALIDTLILNVMCRWNNHNDEIKLDSLSQGSTCAEPELLFMETSANSKISPEPSASGR